MIETENLTKCYGQKVAVKDLDLVVERGEVFAFLGPNGAGKTTTIKVMVGLLSPTKGRVRICGHDVQKEHIQAKSKVSYVPDQPYLYDKLSGREFLNFVGRMYGLGQAERERKIAELTDLFELHDYLDDLCERYSHGMKQRVVVSAALMHDPQVLIVDEPMVGLDPKSARLLKDILRTRARNGCTVFMSTHTLSVAEECADRVGVIHHGERVALGTLAEIRGMGAAGGLEDAFLALTAEDEA